METEGDFRYRRDGGVPPHPPPQLPTYRSMPGCVSCGNSGAASESAIFSGAAAAGSPAPLGGEGGPFFPEGGWEWKGEEWGVGGGWVTREHANWGFQVHRPGK